MEPTTEVRVETTVFDIPNSKMGLVNLLLHEVCMCARNTPEETDEEGK